MPFQFTQQQVADYYETTLDQLEPVQEAIDQGFFADAQSILDVGCGDGKMTAYLAKHYPETRIVGCDISSSMIEFASTHHHSEKYPNLHFLEKDGCQLGFEKEFCRIISFNCLQWIKNQKNVLQEIYRSLKDGGQALLVACFRSSNDDLQVICRELVLTFKWFFYFLNFKTEHSFHSEKEYVKILQDIGFSIDRIEQNTKEVIFQNREGFEKFLKSVLTPMYHLPEKKRSAFLEDLFAGFLKRGNVDAEGKVHLHVAQIEMLITKA